MPHSSHLYLLISEDINISYLYYNLCLHSRHNAKYCRILMNKLYLNLPAIDPSKCIVKLADAINANEKARRLASVMMNEIVKRELSAGKTYDLRCIPTSNVKSLPQLQ